MLHFALGMHPVFIDHHQPHHLNALSAQAESDDVAAIGEIGLDFHHSLNHSADQREKQLIYFEKQLRIAADLQKPVVIHIRKAHDQCIKLLTKYRVQGGIIHAFNGSLGHADKYIELGFNLGFGGMLTFARSNKLHRLVSSIPLEHIVLETDSPYLAPKPYRGKRNESSYIIKVLEKLCPPVPSTTKYKASVFSGETTASREARPGQLIGPLGSP